ncbi:unnamed protein product [Echinostoma caproni]|uniref:DUF2235 domain-containing protein n=1 Tax=Echinostoma caproni TaxID=27848 RepID=A0A183AWE6_9TREM|nr:unnamed protein product [Echinostoma caproni]
MQRKGVSRKPPYSVAPYKRNLVTGTPKAKGMSTISIGGQAGCDVPEAHWVLDQRLGGRKEPYDALTVFGWTLFGPPHATIRKPLSVNFTTTTAGNDAIKQSLQSMYNNELDDLNDQKAGPSVEDKQALATVETGTRYQPDRFEVPLP